MLDLLLCKEAGGWWGVAGGPWGACRPTQRSGSGQGAVGAWGVALEVGVVVGLLAHHSRGQRGHVAQDLDDGLQLAGDVVLQQAGRDDRRT